MTGRSIEHRRSARNGRGADRRIGAPAGSDHHRIDEDRYRAPALEGLHARASALAGIGAWECDLGTEALTWTTGVFDLFGIEPQSAIDRRDIVAMYCEESREEMERLRAHAIQYQRGFTLDARIVRTDGDFRWMRLTACTAASRGRPTHLYGLKQDITEERARWDALRRLAEQDALTGLASRGMFQSRFLDSSRSSPTMVPLGALVLFDVDGLKRINDSWGHAAGDACLKAVADRLLACFPDALMTARIGGDEFAILAPANRPTMLLEQAVTAQLTALAAPIFWRGKLLEISASAGIAPVDDRFAYDAEALFAAADAALYHAKRSGRDTFRTAGEFRAPLVAMGCGARL